MSTTTDTILLRAFLDSREHFDKYGPYIMALKNLERNTKFLLNYIRDFYTKYPKSVAIPEQDLRIFIKSVDMYDFAAANSEWIASIYRYDSSNTDLQMDVIEAACERHFMAEVVDKAAIVLDKGKSGHLSSVQDIIDEFHGILRAPPKRKLEEDTHDLRALIKDITTKGIPFVNKTATDYIGGMKRGQLGLISAYTNVGKTSYSVANCCAAAAELFKRGDPRDVIYAGNEEAIRRARFRAINCFTNWDDNEVARNEKLVDAILKQRGYFKIKWFDHINEISLVDRLLDTYRPRVLFIDQGSKVTINRSKKEGVNALEEVFNNYREMAKKYDATIISVMQGGEGAFEKKYPTLRDLYGTKSAVQGELDWSIAVGVDVSDVNYSTWRFFNINKNKGKEGTYACRFDAERCQFTEATV